MGAPLDGGVDEIALEVLDGEFDGRSGMYDIGERGLGGCEGGVECTLDGYVGDVGEGEVVFPLGMEIEDLGAFRGSAHGRGKGVVLRYEEGDDMRGYEAGAARDEAVCLRSHTLGCETLRDGRRVEVRMESCLKWRQVNLR